MTADRVLATLLLSALANSALAAAPDPGALDEARSGWRHRRAVTVKESSSIQALALPADVMSKSAADLRDLRLLRDPTSLPAGSRQQEVPYIVEDLTPIREVRRARGELVDTRVERRDSTQWLVDLKRNRSFTSLSLRIDEEEFVKRLKIEAAGNREGPYRVVAADAGVFNRVWPWRGEWHLHHTELVFSAPVQARYLRITADDHKSATISISGVEVELGRVTPGLDWSREIELEPMPELSRRQAGSSFYHLNLPPGFPIEKLELRADDAVFARKISLREQAAKGSSEVLGEGLLFRCFPFLPAKRHIEDMAGLIAKADEPPTPSEERVLRLQRRPGAGQLILEIEDGDSPPLESPKVVVSGTARRLVVPMNAEAAKANLPLWLYYGNARARAPQYDLESLKGRLSGLGELSLLQLAEEVNNPRFRTQPPLAFVAPLGASLPVQGYRAQRLLMFGSNRDEDIYGFSLLPEDLGIMKPDLSDLRVVDGHDQQVPYVLSPAESERSLAMSAQPAKSARKTRYALELPDALRTSPTDFSGLPISGVDIEVKDPLFSRRVSIYAPSSDQKNSEREIFTGEIARRAISEADDQESAPPSAVIRLTMGDERLRALWIEIDNQDNAPLHIERVNAVVSVPRVAFKLKPEGRYRVLYGSQEAEAPHYDIELLRRAVLDYAAVPVELGDLQANAAYRVRTADYIREAPPTLVIWSALGIGIVVLLGLTIRLLRQSDTAEDQ